MATALKWLLFSGEIGVNEVKLFGGVATNMKNDEMSGVSEDFYDLNKILKNLLDEDEIDPFQEPTIYVNQFCYRSTAGRVFNIAFFFNAGSLPANVLIKQQLFFCIFCCEAVGSHVMGFICNAAGSISGSFDTLKRKRSSQMLGGCLLIA